MLAFACEINRGAIGFERGGGGFENGYELKASATARLRLHSLLDTIDKVLAFHLQRFFLLNVRDVAVAIVVGIMELGKRVVVWWPIDTNVIDPDFFKRLQIVVNDHAARAHDGHLADFAWFQPAALNGSEPFVAEGKREICYVFYSGSDVSVPLTVHGQRQLVQNVEND